MEQTQTLSQTNADFAGAADHAAGERSLKSRSFEIFIAELGRLKRIVAGMGLSASDAEDVLQDVSVQALKQTAEFRTASEAVHWLIKVTVNRCLAEHRRRKRFCRNASKILTRRAEANTGSTKPDDEVIAAEELEIVREALQKLDGTLLTPMVLRYFCDLNSKKVGEVLDLNPSTVRSRLREGRMTLARRLIEKGIER